jgi:hypothetical protein
MLGEVIPRHPRLGNVPATCYRAREEAHRP